MKTLEGIQYWDWKKLRDTVDGMFRRQKHEAERILYLATQDEQSDTTHQLHSGTVTDQSLGLSKSIK